MSATQSSTWEGLIRLTGMEPSRGSIHFAASHLSAPAFGCEGLWHRNNSARVRIEAAGLIATTRRDLTDPHWRRERPIRLLPGVVGKHLSPKLMAS